jgi:hypothetical protein
MINAHAGRPGGVPCAPIPRTLHAGSPGDNGAHSAWCSCCCSGVVPREPLSRDSCPVYTGLTGVPRPLPRPLPLGRTSRPAVLPPLQRSRVPDGRASTVGPWHASRSHATCLVDARRARRVAAGPACPGAGPSTAALGRTPSWTWKTRACPSRACPSMSRASSCARALPSARARASSPRSKASPGSLPSGGGGDPTGGATRL